MRGWVSFVESTWTIRRMINDSQGGTQGKNETETHSQFDETFNSIQRIQRTVPKRH